MITYFLFGLFGALTISLNTKSFENQNSTSDFKVILSNNIALKHYLHEQCKDAPLEISKIFFESKNPIQWARLNALSQQATAPLMLG